MRTERALSNVLEVDTSLSVSDTNMNVVSEKGRITQAEDVDEYFRFYVISPVLLF
jgi:hypothetical protein